MGCFMFVLSRVRHVQNTAQVKIDSVSLKAKNT